MSNFSFDDIVNAIRKFEASEPQFNNQAIDDMIAKGNTITDLVMVHSIPEMRDMNRVKTKHGYIEVQYTSPLYLEFGKAYVIRKPSSLGFGLKGIETTEPPEPNKVV